jgi:hypothetical protein
MARKKSRAALYTLVQHSAAGYKDDPRFAKAVEEAMVDSQRTEDAIRKRGGLLLSNYGTAHDRAEAENYPPEVTGLIPQAKGVFADYEVGGLKLYIPAAAEKS